MTESWKDEKEGLRVLYEKVKRNWETLWARKSA